MNRILEPGGSPVNNPSGGLISNPSAFRMQAPPAALLLTLPGTCLPYTLGRAVQGLPPRVPVPGYRPMISQLTVEQPSLTGSG